MPDTTILTQPVSVTQADSFVVVSLWRAKEGDGTSYDYETHTTLNAALDAYRDLEDGEYPRARAIGIFAAKNGMPVMGGQIEPARLMRLMRETRAA
jgi:hypothetical protein